MTSETLAKNDLLELNLEHYQWQIAGHQQAKTDGDKNYERVGLLRDRKSLHILKPVQQPPRGDCEIDVYERIWNDHSKDSLTSLRPFVPKYHGKRSVTLNGITSWYLELDDVTSNMKNPCITDIKIGAQTWDPNATEEKIASESTKYAPYAERLCFRFLGMMVYQSQTGNHLVRDKYWGKKVTDNDVMTVLGDYFEAAGARQSTVIDLVLTKLHSIEKWFSQPIGYAFYSSSLLIAYDAAATIEKEPSVEVRMIDFTHVFDHQGCDKNYLNGIRSVIRHVELYKTNLVKI